MTENDMEKTQMANGSLNATQMMLAPGAGATQMGMSVTCPVCRSTTPAGQQYCADCGFLLSSQPVEVVADDSPQILAKMVDVTSGREFTLNPGTNTIGRENADVLVTHPTASRNHAKITVADGKYILEDVGSTNGTFIGSKKVEPGQQVEIEPGTEIIFGSATMRLEAPAPDVAVAAAEAAIEVEEAEDREELAEESVELEQVAEEPTPPSVDEETKDEEAADESDVAQIALEPGVETAFDATPEQSLEEPVEPVEIHEDVPTLARLVPKDGGDEFPIHSGENTIGRRPANNIAILDPFTSGSHAIITAEEGNFVLTDVGSTNGTFVNGERINPSEPRQLSDGDELTFGQAAFRFTT
jgi:pSer/pThr/pTyr-binding forkhead associated (FHA) protein